LPASFSLSAFNSPPRRTRSWCPGALNLFFFLILPPPSSASPLPFPPFPPWLSMISSSQFSAAPVGLKVEHAFFFFWPFCFGFRLFFLSSQPSVTRRFFKEVVVFPPQIDASVPPLGQLGWSRVPPLFPSEVTFFSPKNSSRPFPPVRQQSTPFLQSNFFPLSSPRISSFLKI